MIHVFKKISSANMHYFDLEEVKAFLRITGDDEDKALKVLIKSVVSIFEEYTGRVLLTKNVVLEVQNLTSSALTLPVQPVQKINSIKFTDRAGNVQNITADDYTIFEHTGYLFFNYNPLTYLVEIDFDAGIAKDPKDLPEGIKIALLKHIAFLYKNLDSGRDYDLSHYKKFKILKV